MSWLKSDLTKLFVYLLLSFVSAAILTPFLYAWGKDLASYVALHESNAFLEWLGEKCGRAQFDRFFKRALLLSGLVLLYPLIWSIRSTGRLADEKEAELKPKSGGKRDLLVGLVVSTLLFLVMAMLVWQKNYFVLREDIDFFKIVSKAAGAAVVVSLIEEWLFRGVIFGLLLKKLSARQAVIGVALLYAFVHFSQPPHGLNVAKPEAVGAGFLFLGEVFKTLVTPLNIVANLATLFAMGVILAVVTYKTGKLWAAIGLHSGWVFVYHGFTQLFASNPASSNPYLIGGTLKEGLLPLAMLAITAGCMLVYIRKMYAKEPDQLPS